MEQILTYRGKEITSNDVEFIQRLIEETPSVSRRQLSQQICVVWGWIQKNGYLRDMVCRGLLLELERRGFIQLPPKKCNPPNPFQNRKKPAWIPVDDSILRCSLTQLRPLMFKQVRRTADEPLFNSLIAFNHYLGYAHPVGEQLKYLVFSEDRPIACFSFSSAPRHIKCRDRHIGWTAEQRKKRLSLLSYNNRFLILPWIHVPYLASHLLGAVVRRLSSDWERLYHHPVVSVETFVDLTRFQGTCYRAANWHYVGLTTGRGKNDQTHRPNRSLKAVYFYPLQKNFREIFRDAVGCNDFDYREQQSKK